MRQTVSWYDPDEEATQFGKRPAWQRAKTDLQKKALAACGRKYFKSREERKRWNALEEKARGATEEDILFEAWILHNAKLCERANGLQITRVFGVLLAMIENEERQLDWKVANREHVFADKKLDIESLFAKGRT
ncbi:MAG: hypothetical protein Q8M94_14585 [Ignavibacteria bacterium]|nr:hypothetical protein [Ignavibacteria bacterium]